MESGGGIFSAVIYSEVAIGIIPPGPLSGLTAALRAPRKQPGGKTASGAGLNGCYQLQDSYKNRPEPRLIVVVTDGEDTERPYGNAIAPTLKNNGWIISILTSGMTSESLKAIASAPQLAFYISSSFGVPNRDPIVHRWCSLPKPMDALPSPTPSNTPAPLAQLTFDIRDIPHIYPGAPRYENARAVAMTFHYAVAKKFKNQVYLRVEHQMVSAQSPLFPWNIVTAYGPPSPLPHPYLVQHLDYPSGPSPCEDGSYCALYISITADRDIPYHVMRKTYKKLRRNFKFMAVFARYRNKFRIVREYPNKFAIFIPFNSKY